MSDEEQPAREAEASDTPEGEARPEVGEGGALTVAHTDLGESEGENEGESARHVESEGENEGPGHDQNEASSASPTAPAAPPQPPPPTSPPRSRLASLSFLLVPLVMAITCMASPPDGERDDVGRQLALGVLAGVVGFVAAVLGALSRGPKVAALAFATVCAPWLLFLLHGDIEPVRSVAAFDSPALGHRVAADYASGLVHVGAPTSAVGLVLLALGFALRLAPAEGRPLPRALALGLAPLALLSVVVGVTANLPVVAMLVAASGLALVARAASRTSFEAPATIAPAIVVVSGATLAIVAATSDAAAHGSFVVLDEIQFRYDAASLAPWVARLGRLELAQLAPLAALLPFFALGWLADLRTGGRGVSGARLWHLAPLAIVFATLVWLDARNALDYRHEIRAVLDASGASDLLAHPEVRPAYTFEGEPFEQSFALVSPRGTVSYRGHDLPGGLVALGTLVTAHRAPPLLFDRATPSSTLLHALDVLGHAGVRELRLVARDHGDGHFVTMAIGPSLRGIPSTDRVIVFLSVARSLCVLGSTAGDRWEMPGCDELGTRLADRHAADPNARVLVLGLSGDIDLQRVLEVSSDAQRADFTVRPVTSASAM